MPSIDTTAAASVEQIAPIPVLSGVKPVLELLERDPGQVDMVLVRKGRRTTDTDRLLDLCRTVGVRFTLTDVQALDRLCPAGHQGVVARLYEAGFVTLEELFAAAPDAPLPLIIALDQVQDAGNAGTLARTLYALGGAGLIVPRHNGVYLGAGARRAAAGALERLPVARVTNISRALDAADEAGFAIYAAGSIDPEAAATPPAAPTHGSKRAAEPQAPLSAFTTRLHLPAVLVLGSEEHGVRPQVLKRCAQSVHIPMLRAFDSINVAQAGGILISCFLQQQMARAAAKQTDAGLDKDD